MTINKLIRKAVLYLIAVCIFTLLGCFDTGKKTEITASASNTEGLDSVCTWLCNRGHYFEKNYRQVFFQHYNEQIKQQNLDSAAVILEVAVWASLGSGQCDSVLRNESLSFLQQHGPKINKLLNANLQVSLGNHYWDCGENTKSLDYIKQALTLFPPEKKLKIAFIHQGLGFKYLNISKSDSAVHHVLYALKIAEEIGNFKLLGGCYNTLACIYRYMENYAEAIKYDDKALEQLKRGKDTANVLKIYNNKISLYEEINHPDLYNAIDSLIKIYNNWSSKDIVYRLEMQSRAALKLTRENKLAQAKQLLDSVQPFINDFKNSMTFQFYVNALSEYDIKKGQGTQHKVLYEQMIKQHQEEKKFYLLELYNEVLYEDALIRKDYKSALGYQSAFNTARDSVWNRDLRVKLSELDKKYQTEKKEAQLKEQADDAFKKNIFIGFLVLGLMAFVYFYSLLKKKNTTITQQNELNEQTIAILSHDIKEPLLGVKLLLKKLNKDDPFVAQASQSLEGQINSVNGILTNLLKMKKASLVKKDKNATANANAVVKNVIQELNVAIQAKGLTIHNELSDDVLLPIAAEKLQIIVHNLLSNAIKYSFSNQQIRIFKEGNGISIQDFGVGLSPEQRTKLMREVTASERGTNQERGNGLGLFLVGSMLQGEQLKVAFDSPELGGTIAKVMA